MRTIQLLMKRLYGRLMVRTVLALGLVVASAGVVRAQALSDGEREILFLQDQRQLFDERLHEYLSHDSWRIRRDAAMALANIADTASLPSLITRLGDSSPSVRSAAAFALGQIGSSVPEDTLGAMLRTEKNERVLHEVLDALGKVGTPRTLRLVVRYRPPLKEKSLEESQALSIARYAIRGIKSERAILRCFDLLDSRESDSQWKALYALWRMAPDSLIDAQISIRAGRLSVLSRSGISEVRRQLATLLGRSLTPDAYELLNEMKKNEPRIGSWRVRVQLVRSYARHAAVRTTAVGSLEELLTNRFDNVRVVAMQSLSGLDTTVLKRYRNRDGLLQTVKSAIRSKKNPDMLRGEGIVVVARHFPGEFQYVSWLDRNDVSDIVKQKIIESLSAMRTQHSYSTILKYLENNNVRLATAAWGALPVFASSDGLGRLQERGIDISDLAPTVARKSKGALLRDDMALTTLVAQALSDSAFALFLNAEGYLEAIVEDLMLAYTRLSSPNDVEAMQAILSTLGRVGDDRAIPVLRRALEDPDRTVAAASAEALKQLTGKDHADLIPSASSTLYTDYSWKTLASIPSDVRMQIKTTKGTIIIKLLKEDAPFTVLSFYKLVRKKFYNGLTFHRVVPDFVVQGGDPRGDGWGGPGYSIRTEVSLTRYERGSVGIASAGKDTEGCQFFITHSPQPHLDGRYTIFGVVVRGMGVVDKLQVGDRIEEITILK